MQKIHSTLEPHLNETSGDGASLLHLLIYAYMFLSFFVKIIH